VWLNLRDRFPHPYTERDARAFLRRVKHAEHETLFAITVDGEAVGSIGFMLQPDVERVSAEIGYWIGEAFWGRGIATDALMAVTLYAFEHHELTRLFAVPFATNTASCRVLEKAGYVLEGHLTRSAIKDGIIQDQLQYARGR
jgi:RimJ/RimL family protein N-acetyltransferase